jgi:anti-sigma factor RsiW
MSCDRARRLFGACWDDELTHAEREWLEGHLAACPPCRTEYDAYSRALELVGTLPRVEAPPDLVERVLARSRHAVVAPDVLGAQPVRWVPAAAAAAATVVLLLVAAMFVLPGVLGRGPGSAAAPQVAVTSGPVVAEMVSQSGAEPRTDGGVRKSAVAADDPFDHTADLEFILEKVPARGGPSKPGAEGERAIISF